MCALPCSFRFLLLASCVLSPPLAAQAPEGDDELLQDLVDLLNTRVISASNTAERLSDAPATMVVLTRDDFARRGYTELSQILDDLQGMDIIRPFGDTHLKAYWRGFRNEIGEPFLVMVDGMVQNHLYFNTGDVPLVALPLSNIERVEVVYGPASSVYGANAFMGVINVLTTKDRPEEGSFARATLAVNGGSKGARSSRIADANFFYKRGDLRLSFTARFDNGWMDTNTNNNYEWTKNRYYGDRRLWGNIPDNPSLGGAFESGVRNRAIDLRAFVGQTELGLQYTLLDTGYGTVYPGDLVQNNAVWARPDLSFHLRHTHRIDDWITSTTLLRHRSSDVRNDSFFVDAYESGSAASDYVVEFSWWQSLNRSVSLNQDFDLRLSPAFSLVTGFKFEQKNLQKRYDAPYGELSHVSDPLPLGQGSPFYPDQPEASEQAANRITTEDVGFYAQAKWRMAEGHLLNFGGRRDRNSEYGGNTTLRMGYVFSGGAWGAKVLFGQAYQEPTPRVLYGGWSGSGSNLALKPEKSTTLEASGTYTTRSLSLQGGIWSVRNEDTIAGTRNLGERNVAGLDLTASYLVPQDRIRQVKFWGSYSRIFKADEDVLDGAGAKVGTLFIGDLAKDKVLFGATFLFSERVNATLLGRWIGRRDTVITNPIRSVGSYLVADLSLNAAYKGVTFLLKINNLTDRQYFHPGVRGAQSGDTPGAFSGPGGTWVGSGFSYYNSLHAQPGRYITLGMKMDF